MTDQSLPISRTTRDYIYSAIVVLFLIGSATLLVYLTRSADALIMRQPRMTLVIAITATMFFTAYIFISRSALPFFSRPLAWGSVIVSLVAMGALWIFHSDGTNSGWFRFTILCLTITGCGTILAEVMIFYRRFFADSPWRTNLIHKLGFSIIVALITFSMGYLYYDLGVSGGAILEYQEFRIPESPSFDQQIPEGIEPGLGLDGLLDENQVPNQDGEDISQDPDTPVSNENNGTE